MGDCEFINLSEQPATLHGSCVQTCQPGTPWSGQSSAAIASRDPQSLSAQALSFSGLSMSGEECTAEHNTLFQTTALLCEDGAWRREGDHFWVSIVFLSEGLLVLSHLTFPRACMCTYTCTHAHVHTYLTIVGLEPALGARAGTPRGILLWDGVGA